MKKVFSVILLISISIHVFAFGGSGSGTGTGTGSGSAKTAAIDNVVKTPVSAGNIKDYVDKDKDGTVSQSEIMKAIDEYFEGASPYQLDEIKGLIDGFFD